MLPRARTLLRALRLLVACAVVIFAAAPARATVAFDPIACVAERPGVVLAARAPVAAPAARHTRHMRGAAHMRPAASVARVLGPHVTRVVRSLPALYLRHCALLR